MDNNYIEDKENSYRYYVIYALFLLGVSPNLVTAIFLLLFLTEISFVWKIKIFLSYGVYIVLTPKTDPKIF